MLRRVHRAVCNICQRTLPRAAARCPWCSYVSSEPAKSDISQAPKRTARAAADEMHASSEEHTGRNFMKEVYA